MERDEHHIDRGGPTSAQRSTDEAAEPRRPGGESRHRGDGGAERDDRRGRRKPWHRRPGVVGLIIFLVIAGVIGGALWWRHSRRYVSTEDAFVDVSAQRVSAQVAGRVLRVLVGDNQDVAAGDVLVALDAADPQNRLAQAQASQAQAEAKQADAEAQRIAAEAQREQARANEGVAQASATNAAEDLRRFRELRSDSAGAVSQQQLDRAVAGERSASARLRAAQKAVVAADAQVTHAEKQLEAARAGVKSAATQVDSATLLLSYAEVRASVAGRIARKSVSPGDYVTPGQNLMAVVPREVYVTANFKETALARMRPGQPVKVEVDAFPDLELHGRVDSVQPATGQVFDQIPSQNAAGNWVKVVQRVPVKIILDRLPPDPQRLAPGMSTTVTVTVR